MTVSEEGRELVVMLVSDLPLSSRRLVVNDRTVIGFEEPQYTPCGGEIDVGRGVSDKDPSAGTHRLVAPDRILVGILRRVAECFSRIGSYR